MSESFLKYFSPLDNSASYPVYKQLEEQIQGFINAHPDNTYFPSERQLAQALGLNRATVHKAIAQFLADGQLRRRLKSTVVYKPGRIRPETPKYLPYIDFDDSSLVKAAVLAVPEPSLPLWQNIAADFNESARHPIRVVPRKTMEKAASHISGEIDFQILETNPMNYRDHAGTFHFIDLTQMVRDLAAEEFYPQVFIHDPQRRIWGMAINFTIPFFVRNRKFFSDPVGNWNFEQWNDAMHKLRRDLPRFPYIFSFYGYAPYIYNHGLHLIDPADGKLRLDEELLRKPLERLKELADRDILQPLVRSPYNRLTCLENNQLAMTEYGPKFALDYFHENPSLDFDFIPCPHLDNYILSSEIFAINATSNRYETGMDFLRFALNAENQRKIAGTMHLFPVRRDVDMPGAPPGTMEIYRKLMEKAHFHMEGYYLDYRFYGILDAALERWFMYGGSYSNMIRELRNTAEFYLKTQKNISLI